MRNDVWYDAFVAQGNHLGRIMGYPTINIKNPSILNGKKEGVYACLIRIGQRIYHGALFWGPRKVLKKPDIVIEIYVFDFDKEVYDQQIFFSLQKYIREVMDFDDFDTLKNQIEKDCLEIKSFFKIASQ